MPTLRKRRSVALWLDVLEDRQLLSGLTIPQLPVQPILPTTDTSAITAAPLIPVAPITSAVTGLATSAVPIVLPTLSVPMVQVSAHVDALPVSNLLSTPAAELALSVGGRALLNATGTAKLGDGLLASTALSIGGSQGIALKLTASTDGGATQLLSLNATVDGSGTRFPLAVNAQVPGAGQLPLAQLPGTSQAPTVGQLNDVVHDLVGSVQTPLPPSMPASPQVASLDAYFSSQDNGANQRVIFPATPFQQVNSASNQQIATGSGTDSSRPGSGDAALLFDSADSQALLPTDAADQSDEAIVAGLPMSRSLADSLFAQGGGDDLLLESSPVVLPELVMAQSSVSSTAPIASAGSLTDGGSATGSAGRAMLPTGVDLSVLEQSLKQLLDQMLLLGQHLSRLLASIGPAPIVVCVIVLALAYQVHRRYRRSDGQENVEPAEASLWPAGFPGLGFDD